MLSHAYRITRPARFQRSVPHRRRQGTHPCPRPRRSSRSHRSGCKERRQKTAAGARTPSVSGIVSFAFFFWQTQKRPLSGRTEGVKLRGTTSGLPIPRGRRPWEVRDFSAVTGAPVLPYCTARQGCRALQVHATGRRVQAGRSEMYFAAFSDRLTPTDGSLRVKIAGTSSHRCVFRGYHSRKVRICQAISMIPYASPRQEKWCSAALCRLVLCG